MVISESRVSGWRRYRQSIALFSVTELAYTELGAYQLRRERLGFARDK
jgi:hypothetical protein